MVKVDLALLNGKVTTLDPAVPEASAVFISDGRIVLVGSDAEVMSLVGPDTQVIDANGRRVIPGLIDSHMHVIRGGLNYNMELRWDGVRSLADAMRMLKAQVDRTPAPQWVRFVGGYQDRTAARVAPSAASSCGCDSACGVHGHSHASAWGAQVPVSDDQGFWGALGCSCFAF